MKKLLIGLIIGLMGCGSYVANGTVVDKRIIPAHQEYVLQYGEVWLPQRIPDKYIITIGSASDWATNYWHRKVISVSSEEFNKLEIGQFYKIR